MKTLVVYSRSSTQRPRSVVASLCHWLRQQGHDVTVLDISEFSLINQDLPPGWFARLFNHRVYAEALDSVLTTIGVTRVTLPGRTLPPGALPETVEAELCDAIESDLVTYLNSDVIDTRRGIAKWAAKGSRKRATALFWLMTDFLASTDFHQVYIPNGRVPEQRMAIEACASAGIAHRYYEIGRAKPHSFYAGDTQVHDRESTQAELDQVLGTTPPAEITAMAEEWLAERTSATSTINVFSAGWDEGGAQHNSTPQSAVFFSSSIDEFASYGAAWKLDSWDTQYHAFGEIMSLLESQGVQCHLRIHPNLTNKNPAYFQREIRDIQVLRSEHPDLRVSWHNEPVNSYDLVRQSDYVIVGRSTLGLEAALMGKCVWLTTAARYDLVADVRQALHPRDVTAENFSLWSANPVGAQRFIAYWALQDHEFTFGEKSWCTWDSFRPPAYLRVGQLLIKNPLRHKLHMLLGEVTRRRNSRFTVFSARQKETTTP